MIFPIVDLVPPICEYLSVDDIRALMRVDHHTRNTVGPFTRVRTLIHSNRYERFVATYADVVMIRLGRIIHSDIIISSDIDSIVVHPVFLPVNYTGIIRVSVNSTIVYINSEVGMCQRCSYSLQYSLRIASFNHPTGLSIVEFINLVVNHVYTIRRRAPM